MNIVSFFIGVTVGILVFVIGEMIVDLVRNPLGTETNHKKVIKSIIADNFGESESCCPFIKGTPPQHRRYYPYRCLDIHEMQNCPLYKNRGKVRDWDKELQDCYFRYYCQKAGGGGDSKMNITSKEAITLSNKIREDAERERIEAADKEARCYDNLDTKALEKACKWIDSKGYVLLGGQEWIDFFRQIADKK